VNISNIREMNTVNADEMNVLDTCKINILLLLWVLSLKSCILILLLEKMLLKLLPLLLSLK